MDDTGSEIFYLKRKSFKSYKVYQLNHFLSVFHFRAIEYTEYKTNVYNLKMNNLKYYRYMHTCRYDVIILSDKIFVLFVLLLLFVFVAVMSFHRACSRNGNLRNDLPFHYHG